MFFRRVFLVLSLVLGLFMSLGFRAPSAEAKYKTAMLFSGSGLNIVIFLGMLEGIESQGIHPDVVVGTCGGQLRPRLFIFFLMLRRDENLLNPKTSEFF